ncbi:High-affinity choline transporter 1, partial [Trichinella pseudospiralis]
LVRKRMVIWIFVFQFVLLLEKFAILYSSVSQPVPVAEQMPSMPPEAYLDTCGMASVLNYLCEEHIVVTEDGYILRIHRISNDKDALNISSVRKEPVLLQHGLLQSSIDWVINFDNESLGYLLADAGYDVWLGNVRGNTYGRQHKTLHPSSKLFWTFSFDEMAKYDLKAIIDYIFNKTGKQALHYAGHSQGSLLGFILFSEEPTWAETRIRTFHALAPVAYLGNTTSFIKSIAPISGIMKFIIELFGGYEFLPSTKVLQIIGGNLCQGRTAFLCENIILFIAGYDYKHINSSRLPVYLSHSPAGSSTMNIIHYLQLMNSGKMQKFDFGKIGNLKKYGQISPPLYHANNVKLPVALYWGSDDIFSVEKDVLHLQSELPNLLGSYLYNETDHLDFVWGLHMPSGPNQSENGTVKREICRSGVKNCPCVEASTIQKMAFNIVGLVALIVFYLMILLVGLWAARKTKSTDDSEDVMLAGRNIGLIVGIFTMTATWVGGGYISGTAEIIYDSGLINCQAPLGYAASLSLGGILFAEKMRNEGYVTMLDPFQQKFGERMVGLLFIPALLGEVFWSGATLSALGASLTVILNIPNNISVIVSASIAVFYTFCGGLYSVAYTDVVQLISIFIGLWICIPPAILHDATQSITYTAGEWVGSIPDVRSWFLWIDSFLLLTLGGIPWQAYFQRVLSSKSAWRAKVLSYVAAIGCFIMAIPSMIIGMVAKSANWTMTDWEPYENGTKYENIPYEFQKLTLPLVLDYLNPSWATFIGLGAVSAATMSSADSSILSAASMFARNIWKLAIRPHASEKEIIWVMKISIVLVGAMAMAMALSVDTIYGLWFLCSDLVYVILFPQLLCVVYMKKANTYGALSGYIVGLFFRVSGGETLLGFPALIQYPWYDPVTETQYFPFKTMSMLLSLLFIVGVSYGSDYIFKNGILAPEYDVFMCVVNIPVERIILKDPSLAASMDMLESTKVHWNKDGLNAELLNVVHNEGFSNASSAVATPARDVRVEESLPLSTRPDTKINYEAITN